MLVVEGFDVEGGVALRGEVRVLASSADVP